MFVRILPLLVAAFVAAAPSAAHAQLRARLLASGFDRPNGVYFDPVVPGAIYLVDQAGLIRTFLNGVERPTPFLDLRSVVQTGGEQGLLGMAFPPDAATTGRVFVHFTIRTAVPGEGHSVVARFTRSAGDQMVADPASRFDLQWPAAGGGRQGFITQPFGNHNGGHLAFGPDGYLYIGMGDGGSGDDPQNNAQTPGTLLGKMLRIDVAGNPPNGYSIPATNPVFPVAGALPEIWAFGLRNPWRYQFDDFGAGATGALFIGDVGQGDREELDIEPAGQGGRNYGWRVYEGTIENPRVPPLGPAYLPLQAPSFEYTHAVGQAITGGFVYRGSALGAGYQGRYFYADCVQGKVFSLAWTIDSGSGEAVVGPTTDHTSDMGGPFRCISSFARDPNGELYFMDFSYSSPSGTGRVFVIENAFATTPGPPSGLASSVSGNTVSISWNPPTTGGNATGYLLEAGSAPGLSNLASFATTSPNLVVTGVPSGQYFVRVRATSAAGAGAPTSDLTINVGCTAPAAPATFTAAVSGTTVTLGWSVAAGTTQTVIEAGYAPGATALTVSSGGSGAVFPGVPPGTYYVRTRAVNACGQGPVSVERTVVVP